MASMFKHGTVASFALLGCRCRKCCDSMFSGGWCQAHFMRVRSDPEPEKSEEPPKEDRDG